MSKVVFRSPRTGSAAAATAPARLAQELGAAVLWRERADGGVEVVAMRGANVDRYVVAADASVELVESIPPPAGFRGGTPVWIGGLVTIASAIVLGVTGVPGAPLVGFAGWVLVLAGVGLRASARELAARAKRLGEGEWHNPTDLHDWVPRSIEQLAAVEEIADAHDGLAYVRDLGSKTIEVRALRAGRLEHFWVDENGRTEVTERTSLARRHYVDRGLQTASFVLWFGFIAALFAHRWLLAGVVIACLAALMTAGCLNDRHVQERVTKPPPDGQAWIEIRTQLVVDDGD